jgi:hypothetical protein
MAHDFLDETRRQIGDRLKELKPLVDEYRRLEVAAAALDGGAPAAPPKQRGSASPRRRGTPTGARRGRPKGSGTRAREALEMVRANPGITIPEIAQRMGIRQNYLYRVLPGLADDGAVTKNGNGWFPKEAAGHAAA